MQFLIERTPGDPSTGHHYSFVIDGSFAHIFVTVPDTVPTPHILKKPRRNDEISRRLYKEEFRILNVIKERSHPHMIQFMEGVYDASEDKFLDNTYFMFEFANSSDLHTHIRHHIGIGCHFPTRVLYELILGISSGIEHLHENCGVIHRDLKPENIMLHCVDGKMIPKIGDFGLSCQMPSFDAIITGNIAMGSPEYMAPESLTAHEYSAKSDVYSFAVLMSAMVSFSVPYADLFSTSKAKGFQKVTSGFRDEAFNRVYPELVFKMIHDSWAPKPEDRPFAKEITACLRHTLQDPSLPESEFLLPLVHTPRVSRQWDAIGRFGIFDAFSRHVSRVDPSQDSAAMDSASNGLNIF